MVVTEKVHTDIEITLQQLVQHNPVYLGIVLEAFELLLYQNEELKKIASRYSHDLRSPVTNINMLLQLYDKSENESDRRIYVHKISTSLDRLQTGFEQLSADRKNSLRRDINPAIVSIEEIIPEIKNQLPQNIKLITDFDSGSEILGQPHYIFNALLVLLLSATENTEISALQLSTARTWEGTQLSVKYPEFMGFKNSAVIDNHNSKNKLPTGRMQIHAWNYYFALLFLGAMGAAIQVEENERGNTSEIIISFIQ